MDFEKNYQARILSNYLITSLRLYSLTTNTLSNSFLKYNPWYLTGFSDGESNFTVRIVPSNTTNIGWSVQPVFQIGLHKKDLSLL